MQWRLQQTVEGLSVAAISYYVVSLLGYLLKGIPMVHDSVAPVMAVLVPAVMLTIWWIVRRIRHAHGDTAAEEKSSCSAAVLARERCAVRLNRPDERRVGEEGGCTR